MDNILELYNSVAGVSLMDIGRIVAIYQRSGLDWWSLSKSDQRALITAAADLEADAIRLGMEVCSHGSE